MHAAGLTRAKWHSGPARGAPVRSPLFSRNLFHDLDLEIPLSDQLLQPVVLQLQRLQTLHVIADHLAETLAPRVDRRVAHAVALRHLGNRRTVCLPQNPNNLLIAESTLLHDALHVDAPL